VNDTLAEIGLPCFRTVGHNRKISLLTKLEPLVNL